MAKLKYLFVALFCMTAGLQAQQVTYLWDYDELLALRQRPKSASYKQIVAQANKVLKSEPVTVVEKTKTISGDKHNYESLATYCWPDPANPGGPYIIKDCETNPEINEYDFPRLLQLGSNCSALSKAFFLTGNRAYYEALCDQLDAWFVNADTKMWPNFAYSQVIPGRNNNQGNPGGVIDVYRLMDVLESVRLANDVKSLGRRRMKSLRKWFRSLAQWIEESDNGQKAQQFRNNHSIVLQGSLFGIYLFTNQYQKINWVCQTFCQRVDEQIEDDGRMPQELSRPNALTYSVFNLNHILDFCQMAQSAQISLPQSTLSKVTSSCRYLEPFVGNRERFPYKEGNWTSAEKNLKRELARRSKMRQ